MARLISTGAVLLCCVYLVSGCAADSVPEEVGAAELALSTPSGARIDNVEYLLTGPDGYRKAGSFTTPGDGTAFTYALPGIPAGPGYEIELTAKTSDERACRGKSRTFEVIRMQSVSVAVRLSCPGLAHGGTVVVNGELNTCPVVDAVVATPSAARLGERISLAAFATDEDNGPGSLSYTWSEEGSVGYFASPQAGSEAQFLCNDEGVAQLKVTAADGDSQCTGNVFELSVTTRSRGRSSLFEPPPVRVEGTRSANSGRDSESSPA